MQNSDVANLVAERIFGQKKPGDIPYILCRRSVRPGLTYNLHDASWEGLKRVTKNGTVSFEIDHNFNLIINTDGTCLIPDTEYNRKRLDALSKPRTTAVKRKRIDFSTVPPTETEEDGVVTEPPLYQRVEDNIVEQSLVEKLAEQVRKKLLGDENAPVVGETFDPGAGEEDAFSYEPQPGGKPDSKPTPKVDVSALRKRGRPKKSPLLSPLRGQDDHE